MSSRQFGAIYITVFVLFAICLTWPIHYTGHLLAFADTGSYLRGGERIWDILMQMVPSAPAEQAATGAGQSAADSLATNESGRNTVGRSFPYAAFTYLFYQLGGPLGIALAQSALAALMITFMISRDALQSPWTLVIGAILIAATSGLPWYASFLMPDIFGAFVVIFGVILVRDIDNMRILPALLLVGLTGFAATTHYGNMPVILVAVTAALGMRLLRRRLTWRSTFLGLIALALAPLANVGASTVVLDEPSLAPKRLPIILARSLSDGPAQWYLQDVCPEADLAICQAYGDDVSADRGVFLWSEEGVLSLPPEVYDRIRQEEFKVVFAAFRAYPLAQANAFFSEAIKQNFRIGLEQIEFAKAIQEPFEVELIYDGPATEKKYFFDTVIDFATLASAVALIALGLGLGFTARWTDMLIVLITTMTANAVIFGGLSAAIDRYQGRMAWIIPVMLVLFIAEARANRRSA